MKRNKGKVERTKFDKFMHARFMHDSINKAINKAKTLGFSEADCQPIIIEKLKNLQVYKSMCGVITSTASTNVVRFNDNWFGIICQGKSQLELLVYPLKPELINTIELNFAVDRARPRSDYGGFVQENLDDDALNAYMLTVTRERDAILSRILGCENVVKRGGRSFMITTHCLRRWLERVDGVDPQLTVENRPAVIKRMTTSFRRSERVYAYVDGSTTFYLDPVEMIFYAVSPDDVILSLWINSYGFSERSINDASTLLQLANVRQRRHAYTAAAAEVDRKVSAIENDLSLVVDELTDVNARLAELLETKATLVKSVDELKANVAELNTTKAGELARLNAEEGLLFKNHRRLLEDLNEGKAN